MIHKWKLLKLVNAEKNLNDAARRVMFFLLDRENNKTRALFPSHRRLAEDTNLSLRSVSRGITSLVKYGYLSIKKKGYPGRATDYEIIYKTDDTNALQSHHTPHLTDTHDTIVQNNTTDMADQLTNIIKHNKLTVEGEEMTDKKVDVSNLVSKFAKNLNINYRQVTDGKKLAHNSPEAIRRRYLIKTNSMEKTQDWYSRYLNPKTSQQAWEEAVHLQIVRVWKKR